MEASLVADGLVEVVAGVIVASSAVEVEAAAAAVACRPEVPDVDATGEPEVEE